MMIPPRSTAAPRNRRGGRLSRVVLAGVLLSGCGTAVGRGGTAGSSQPPIGGVSPTLAPDGSVPYVDEPAGAHEFDPPRPTEPSRGDAKRCTADRLEAELAGWTRQGDGGEPGVRRSAPGLIGMVRVTLRAGTPCTLQGTVSARLRIDGSDAPVQYSNNITDEAKKHVTVVTAGSPAQLRVGWSPPYCGPTGAQVLLIDLPGGGGAVAAAVRAPSTPVCSSGSEGDRGLRTYVSVDAFTAYPVPDRDDSPYVVLVAKAEAAPSSVRAGQLLEYRVRLSNPTDRVVPLTPCPGFVVNRFILGKDRTGFNTTQVYRLDCRPVGAVPARGSVVFQMRAQVPQDPPGGPTLTVTWRLVSPSLRGRPNQSTDFTVPLEA